MRATGRTTRMLADALEQARNGKAVYVIAADSAHVASLQSMAGEEAYRLGIKFETWATLSNLDCRTLSLRGAHPKVVVLADHHAIESEFSAILKMLHRYDHTGAAE